MTEAATVIKAGTVAGASAATGHVAKVVALVTALKWAGVGAVVGTVALGGAAGVKRLTSPPVVATPLTGQQRNESAGPRESASPSSPVRDLQPQPQPPDPQPVAQPTNRAPLPQAPAVRINTNTEAAPVVEPPVQADGTRVADPASPLEEEVTRIDRARSALAGGAPARALLELDEYDRRFLSGMMRLEATVVRIEAMAQSGNLEGAKALGRRFLIAHPVGGLALRVHKVIGE
jgi:hypothetical protein